ncbi:type II secretion system protein [Candidatus Dojkabacteria bacterium]|nr:type II secretion system protein [Candidatus Dojkabacteria bacterium]
MATALSKKTKILGKNNDGYTLIELLVVMAIISALFLVSWAGFYGLNTTMRLRQASENMKSDIVYAQRAAMLLKRDVGENWVSGIGIDLRDMYNNDDDLRYTLFKWCSSSPNYVDFEDNIPNFPEDYNTGSDACITGSNELVVLPNKKNILVSSSGMGFRKGRDGLSDSTDRDADALAFIVFESVTGIPHFFDEGGGYISEPSDVEYELLLNIRNRTNGVYVEKAGDVGLLLNFEFED